MADPAGNDHPLGVFGAGVNIEGGGVGHGRHIFELAFHEWCKHDIGHKFLIPIDGRLFFQGRQVSKSYVSAGVANPGGATDHHRQHYFLRELKGESGAVLARKRQSSSFTLECALGSSPTIITIPALVPE